MPGCIPQGGRSVKGAEEQQAVPLRITVMGGVLDKGSAVCQLGLSGAAGL